MRPNVATAPRTDQKGHTLRSRRSNGALGALPQGVHVAGDDNCGRGRAGGDDGQCDAVLSQVLSTLVAHQLAQKIHHDRFPFVFVRCARTLRLPRGPTKKVTPYAAAAAMALLALCHRVFTSPAMTTAAAAAPVAMTANAMPYSAKSCPLSSLTNLLRRFIMIVFLLSLFDAPERCDCPADRPKRSHLTQPPQQWRSWRSATGCSRRRR